MARLEGLDPQILPPRTVGPNSTGASAARRSRTPLRRRTLRRFPEQGWRCFSFRSSAALITCHQMSPLHEVAVRKFQPWRAVPKTPCRVHPGAETQASTISLRVSRAGDVSPLANPGSGVATSTSLVARGSLLIAALTLYRWEKMLRTESSKKTRKRDGEKGREISWQVGRETIPVRSLGTKPDAAQDQRPSSTWLRTSESHESLWAVRFGYRQVQSD